MFADVDKRLQTLSSHHDEWIPEVSLCEVLLNDGTKLFTSKTNGAHILGGDLVVGAYHGDDFVGQRKQTEVGDCDIPVGGHNVNTGWTERHGERKLT